MKVPELPFAPFRERANPVLVRELRQSFRGKQFRIVFALASSFGLVASLVAMMLDEDPTGIGRSLFGAFGVALAIACLVLVPVGAFQSLSSEWEEGTWDLLEMTSLRPWQIVLGKLLSAGVQCLLYFVGLAPFLVFCFVLRGVGVLAIGFLLVHLLVSGIAATAVAIAMSSLTRQRVLRGVLLGLLVMILVPMGTGVGGAMLGMMVFRVGGAGVPASAMWFAMASWATSLLTFAALAYCVACARLSHPEENRSTPLRVVASAALLIQLAWIVLASLAGATAPSAVSLVSAAILTAAFGALFASEREAFGRRTRLQVPRAPVRARLAAPWLPGGGRGVMWMLFHLAALIALAPVLGGHGPSGSLLSSYRMLLGAWIPGVEDRQFTDALWGGVAGVTLTSDQRAPVALAVVACYLVFYVGVATSALSWVRPDSAPLRVARALAPFVLFVLTALVPGILGVLLEDADLMSLSHPFNPIAVAGGVLSGSDVSSWRWYPPILAALGLALALPRCRRALVEVAQASLARRERERTTRPAAAA